jgi:hypothetical protein
MHIWPIVFVILLVVLIAGVATVHAAGALMQSLGNHPRLD